MREGIRATILGGGGGACEPLMWGLERLGVPIPEWVATVVVLVSAALLLLALATLTHMGAVWLRSKGRGKLGQGLIAAIGAIFVVVGLGSIAYALIWFQPLSAKAQIAPPTEGTSSPQPGNSAPPKSTQPPPSSANTAPPIIPPYPCQPGTAYCIHLNPNSNLEMHDVDECGYDNGFDIQAGNSVIDKTKADHNCPPRK